MTELYRNPLYYDIAFSWDLESEIAFFEEVFEEHVQFPVGRILETACGTGRFLRALPSHGYDVTGYDISPEMIAFARASIRRAGLSAHAQALPGDMRTSRFAPRFDVALSSINSFCYLLEDGDVESHLCATADSLRPGGVYIIHCSMAYDGEPPKELSTWTMERDGVRVTTSWGFESEDAARGRSVQVSKLEIDDRGERFTISDRHELRAWSDDGFRFAVSRSGAFRLAGVRGDGHEYARVPIDTRITGEMGNHYFILQKKA